MIWNKEGVQGDLAPVVRKALGRIAGVYAAEKRDLFVTSKRDGNHSLGSLHYEGLAVDFRWDNFVDFDSIKAAAGPGFDVVAERTHIHLEWDPK